MDGDAVFKWEVKVQTVFFRLASRTAGQTKVVVAGGLKITD